MKSICFNWTTRKHVCEQCKKGCQIHINIKNIAKMNIMNIEDEGRQEDLHSRWTTPCRRHLNSTPAEVTKDWCHLFLVTYCKYFPINFKIHETLPFRKKGHLSKILIVCFFIVVAQQMFFSANLFRCFYPARALRALGLLLADGAPTVGGGKTFWAVSRIFLREQL